MLVIVVGRTTVLLAGDTTSTRRAWYIFHGCAFVGQSFRVGTSASATSGGQRGGIVKIIVFSENYLVVFRPFGVLLEKHHLCSLTPSERE